MYAMSFKVDTTVLMYVCRNGRTYDLITLQVMTHMMVAVECMTFDIYIQFTSYLV